MPEPEPWVNEAPVTHRPIINRPANLRAYDAYVVAEMEKRMDWSPSRLYACIVLFVAVCFVLAGAGWALSQAYAP